MQDFWEYMEEHIDPEHEAEGAFDLAWAAELEAEYAFDEDG